jgi:predicted transcriptional regulator
MSDVREITDLQLMILDSLWRRREATVRDVHGDIAKRARASRKTVATLLARLESKGMVRHRLDGREGLYRATVTRRRCWYRVSVAYSARCSTGDGCQLQARRRLTRGTFAKAMSRE